MKPVKQTELVQFLKEEHQRIEDALYKLGEFKEIKKDADTLNNYIQDRFCDALMYLNHGKTDELRELLERASKEKWVS